MELDPTCWRVIGLLAVAVTALGVAVATLWRAYKNAVRALIKAKEEHIRVLEAIRRHVQGG